MKLDVDKVYEMLIDGTYFTEDELDLLTGIYGYSLETLNDACRYRFGGDIEDVLELEEDEEEGEETLYKKVEEVLDDNYILYGDLVETDTEVIIVGVDKEELPDLFSYLEDEGLSFQLRCGDVILLKEDY